MTDEKVLAYFKDTYLTTRTGTGDAFPMKRGQAVEAAVKATGKTVAELNKIAEEAKLWTRKAKGTATPKPAVKKAPKVDPAQRSFLSEAAKPTEETYTKEQVAAQVKEQVEERLKEVVKARLVSVLSETFQAVKGIKDSDKDKIFQWAENIVRAGSLQDVLNEVAQRSAILDDATTMIAERDAQRKEAERKEAKAKADAEKAAAKAASKNKPADDDKGNAADDKAA